VNSRIYKINSYPLTNLQVKSLERGYDGKPRVWFVATCDIEPDEELLWDYGEDYWYADDTIA